LFWSSFDLIRVIVLTTPWILTNCCPRPSTIVICVYIFSTSPTVFFSYLSFFQKSGDMKKSGQPSAIRGPNMATLVCYAWPQRTYMSYDRTASAKYRDTRKIFLFLTCFFTVKINEVLKRFFLPIFIFENARKCLKRIDLKKFLVQIKFNNIEEM